MAAEAMAIAAVGSLIIGAVGLGVDVHNQKKEEERIVEENLAATEALKIQYEGQGEALDLTALGLRNDAAVFSANALAATEAGDNVLKLALENNVLQERVDQGIISAATQRYSFAGVKLSGGSPLLAIQKTTANLAADRKISYDNASLQADVYKNQATSLNTQAANAITLATENETTADLYEEWANAL